MTFVKAKLRKGEAWQDVQIGNVSSTGLLVRLADPPAQGEQVELRHRGWRVTGEVVWRSRSRMGVRANEAIDIDSLLADSDIGSSMDSSVSEVFYDAPAPSFWKRLRGRTMSD